MTTVAAPMPAKSETAEREDRTLLLFAGLMEGGKEDDETCRSLDELTKLLNDDVEATQAKKADYTSICHLIDGDCVDTILQYLDMRTPEVVRGHATLTTSAYLKAAGNDGAAKLSDFFFDRVRRGTYDDYIVAFCVAGAIFPIVPDLTSELFLSQGFLGSLGPLMRRKWKSRKVETACLEMLNAACMNTQCRDAVQKYCTEWLEEIVDEDPNAIIRAINAQPEVHLEEGSISMRRHSEQVRNMAAVILAKLGAVAPPSSSLEATGGSRVQPATTSIEELSTMFATVLLNDEQQEKKHSIEGLAYASLQPTVKEKIAHDKPLLKRLVKTLSEAEPKSPLTYGTLSILVNLTRYQPNLSEEEKKMAQLKAYANAAGKVDTAEPLNDNDHVAKRCKLVFEAGVTPVLVTHSKNGSAASLSLCVAVISSLSVTQSLRGQLAQQGAVKLLLSSWSALPEAQSESTQSTSPARRVAAQALARILISTNPSHVFGGTRSNPQSAALRPLISILPPDPAAETRDLLPTFEALMALTNLASTDDEETRKSIIRLAWSQIEEQMLSSNARVSKAAVELVCNLVQAPEAVILYADGTPQARQRLHILLALADAEDEGTRSAAGGALASLTGFEEVVRPLLQRERGVEVVLGLCADSSENLRHRGVFVLYNIISADGETGVQARRRVKEANGIEILKGCAKASRRHEVVEVTVEALKVLLEE